MVYARAPVDTIEEPSEYHKGTVQVIHRLCTGYPQSYPQGPGGRLGIGFSCGSRLNLREGKTGPFGFQTN